LLILNRHWAVFVAGLATMVIFWAVTPIQSAILTIGTVSRTRQTSMIATGFLLPTHIQRNALNANFLNAAFAISWLGEKLPPYTTREFALQPFTPVESPVEMSSTMTWAASTLAYSTAITCKPANVTLQGRDAGPYRIDSGDGCTVDLALPSASDDFGEKFVVQYIQYWNNAQDDWALENPKCNRHMQINSSHYGPAPRPRLTVLEFITT
jgi:hypothetical protein